MISSPPPFATSSPGRRSAGSSRVSISSRTTTSISGVDTNCTRYGHQQRQRKVDGVTTIHEQQFWPPSRPARRNNNSNASYSSARRPLPSLPIHLRLDRQASFLLSSRDIAPFGVLDPFGMAMLNIFPFQTFSATTLSAPATASAAVAGARS